MDRTEANGILRRSLPGYGSTPRTTVRNTLSDLRTYIVITTAGSNHFLDEEANYPAFPRESKRAHSGLGSLGDPILSDIVCAAAFFVLANYLYLSGLAG